MVMCFSLFSDIPEFKVGKVFKGSISCTDQLPAKRRILPHPCPECGSDYGSIRIAVLTGTTLPIRRSKLARRFVDCGKTTVNKKTGEKTVHFWGKTVVLVRIKHYDPDGYSSAKELTNSKPASTINEEKAQKELMTAQQKWCNFRIDEDFAYKFEPITKHLVKKFESLDERKSFEFRPSDLFIKAVKEKGWNVLSHKSQKYRNTLLN